MLIELGSITEDEADRLLELYFGVPYIKLSEYILERDALNLVPETECVRNHLIPVSVEGNILTIAMADPRDVGAIGDVRILSEKEVRTVYSSLDDIQRAIKMYYPRCVTLDKDLPDSAKGE